jgi:hypothetical protein
MRRRSGNRSPYWLFAKYPAMCSKCKAAIPKGGRAFYYPSTRTMLCSGIECGDAAGREFVLLSQDEAVMDSQWGGR